MFFCLVSRSEGAEPFRERIFVSNPERAASTKSGNSARSRYPLFGDVRLPPLSLSHPSPVAWRRTTFTDELVYVHGASGLRFPARRCFLQSHRRCRAPLHRLRSFSLPRLPHPTPPPPRPAPPASRRLRPVDSSEKMAGHNAAPLVYSTQKLTCGRSSKGSCARMHTSWMSMAAGRSSMATCCSEPKSRTRSLGCFTSMASCCFEPKCLVCRQ
jgi:hypothetical protein